MDEDVAATVAFQDQRSGSAHIVGVAQVDDGIARAVEAIGNGANTPPPWTVSPRLAVSTLRVTALSTSVTRVSGVSVGHRALPDAAARGRAGDGAAPWLRWRATLVLRSDSTPMFAIPPPLTVAVALLDVAFT